MKAFRAPQDTIGTLDAQTAATLVATASDIALVLDRDGVIRDLAFQRADLSHELEGAGEWFGRPWSDTVSPDSQPKVVKLLREAEANVASGWRQLTHQTPQGRGVPILYAAVKLGDGERIVALGRDLRAVSALQQRLVDAQMSMERDYAKLRFAETRYRLLFQSSKEPVVILDGGSHRILEANPAAGVLLDAGAKRAVGRLLADMFEPPDRTVVQAFLAELRASGRADDVEATLSGRGRFVVSATQFRQETSALILIRLSPLAGDARAAGTGTGGRASEGERLTAAFLEASPDGVVLTDGAGTILAANPSFAGMVQAADGARGAALDQWLGRPGVDFNVLMANLRQHGTVRLFATTLNGGGAPLDVEASAAAIGTGKAATYGFTLRDVGRRIAATPRSGQGLPHSAEQLADLIGRVPLKELVRETTDVIEKLCIEAALELTGDNRASAAEILGLSRQSLYVKLRRFGFADVTEDDA